MKWLKHGIIYNTNAKYNWNQTHAQLPTVNEIEEKRWRIYFSTRDEENRSLPTFIDVEIGNPKNILYEHNRPIMSLGKNGAFDDSGVMPSCIVDIGDKKYLYYTGWTLKSTVPYHTSIGMAISEDGGKTFERFSERPLFGKTNKEPYINGNPSIIVENGLWRCWYFSCTKWEFIRGRCEPFYHIKYAESLDGINWKRNGTVAIDYKSEEEAGIARVSLLREDGIYKCWLCYRNAIDYRTDKNNSYRIGYAESSDGIYWSRDDDEVGIDVSDNGWDSEMMAYPYVILNNRRKYLFYNGNGFGKSGFGYAIESS